MGMTIEEAKKSDHFLCSDCSSDDDAKRSLNVFPVSPSLEVKVRMYSSCFNLIKETKISLAVQQHLLLQFMCIIMNTTTARFLKLALFRYWLITIIS